MDAKELNAPQPPPVASDRPAISDMVIEDIRERNRIGTKK